MARRRARRALVVGRYIRRRSLNSGLLGDSGLWRLAFYAVTVRTLARKLMGKDAEIVLTEPLRPGRPLVIEAIDGKRRQRERAAARAAGATRRQARRI